MTSDATKTTKAGKATLEPCGRLIVIHVKRTTQHPVSYQELTHARCRGHLPGHGDVCEVLLDETEVLGVLSD